MLILALRPETKLQMFASENIGLFAADAFDNSAEYLGQQLELATDERTGPQIAEVFERVSGMFGWFNDEGFRADVPALRARHPGDMGAAGSGPPRRSSRPARPHG